LKFWKYFGPRSDDMGRNDIDWRYAHFLYPQDVSIRPGRDHDQPDSIAVRLHGAGAHNRDCGISLRLQFGLEGSLWEQYVSFLWKGLLHFDFGPRWVHFPHRCGEIISRYLPYTLFLSLTSTVVAWLIGNLIGLLGRVSQKQAFQQDIGRHCHLHLPAAIFLLSHWYCRLYFPIFLRWFLPVIHHIGRRIVPGVHRLAAAASILPAVAAGGNGWWIISMKSLVGTRAEEDFVLYYSATGLIRKRIGTAYVFHNSILTQITALAMSLGGVFNGSIMTEIIFGYPGVGTLIQNAIPCPRTINTIMGCIHHFHCGHFHSELIADIIYPLSTPHPLQLGRRKCDMKVFWKNASFLQGGDIYDPVFRNAGVWGIPMFRM
jgi:peptide/nickel transport system permease protein